MRFFWLVTLPLVACGSPVVGTWSTTSTVTFLTSAGSSTPKQVVSVFEIGATSWNLGGGCQVPLTFSGPVAELAMPDFKCTLQSTEGLPLEEVGFWRTGALVVVQRARFEAEMNKLKIDFLARSPTDPNDLDSGDFMEFKPTAGAERVK